MLIMTTDTKSKPIIKKTITVALGDELYEKLEQLAKQDERSKVKSRALTDAEVDAILCQPDTNKLVGLRDKAILLC